MPNPSARAFLVLAFLAFLAAVAPGCGAPAPRLLPRSQTWAELRVVRRGVTVTPPGEAERAPYPRERLVDGEAVTVGEGGLGWLRRDGGATLLVRGPARLTLRAEAVEIAEGRVFIDTPAVGTTTLVTPAGPLQLAQVRASLEVTREQATVAYVLAGEVRGAEAVRATAGETLRMEFGGATHAPALSWEDWTGGLGTTFRSAAPAPYGVGTVGARGAGDQGTPRFPLAIQKLSAVVTIDRDFAVTEVDETFFNPSSEVVEGLYRFRTPAGATLHRFGVDRDGVIVWGHVKEKAAAAAQYQANVYQGSTEDPALLEWDAPGVYRARLYPIGPGESRRVVVRYAEWLGRTGAHGERRLYVYPMAAEGAEGSLPVIEELSVRFDLSRAAADEVRVGMAGVREGTAVTVREHDLVPRADLALELFDHGGGGPAGYRAPHARAMDTLPPAERGEAERRDRAGGGREADYVLVRLRPGDLPAPAGGLDLAIVVDTSAATDPSSLSIARAATAALLAHLGTGDRVAAWAGDTGLRPLLADRPGLIPVDADVRRRILAALAAATPGGATDLGGMLGDAASALDPQRRGAVVYIGDAVPTVGEASLGDLATRLARLPRPVRIFGLGVGDRADLALLQGLARGALAVRIGDGNEAARAALLLLEQAERPALLGASIDLGPTVERIFPRDLGALLADESLLVVGRTAERESPSSVTVTSPSGAPVTAPLQVTTIEDRGDLSQRWAEGRLAQLLDEGAGRAAMVDLGMRHGIMTPYTSFYVPTKREQHEPHEQHEQKEADPHVARKQALDEASAFGMIGLLDGTPSDLPRAAESGDRWGSDVGESFGAGGLGLNGVGEGGGGRGEGIGLGGIGTLGHGAGTGTGEGFGSGHGRLGGAHRTRPPQVRQGTTEVSGKLPVEVVQRVVRQSFGRYRLCYENGLRTNPNLQGRVTVRFVIGRDGTAGGVSDGGSDLPDQAVVSCVRRAFFNLSFPSPAEGVVAVTYPILFAPGEGSARADEPAPVAPARARESALSVTVHLDELPRAARLCGDAASVPLEDRVALWRERLARSAPAAEATARVYRQALGSCEAPTWRERARLLAMVLDAIPTVKDRVGVWRALFDDTWAAAVLYQGILARVRTPEEAQALHAALGLRTMDPGQLARLIKETPLAANRVSRLQALWKIWPDDFAVAMRLLDALEDAGDDAGARALGRELRARPDADAALRTAVGELYLRLSGAAKDAIEKASDEAEGRRAFGEIVEFAPDDPVARRRLGDLLRAHRWYADAMRQYETLARLTPDDASVWLLVAAAAEGLGKLESAVKWTERASAGGAPGEGRGPASTARAFAATYLAWGRLEATAAGRADEAKTLAARLTRVVSTERGRAFKGARVALTWAHPELHPSLWTRSAGAPVPAPEGDLTLGIAQAVVPTRGSVEVRVPPDELEHVARLGATATLTVVFAEGEDGERTVRLPVAFTRDGTALKRFALADGEVREVAR